MQAKLTELNYNEILMYLGYRGQPCPPEVEDQIRRCMDQVMDVSNPRLVYRRIPSMGEAVAPLIQGKDLTEMLAECHELVLMAVTLGQEIERLLMKTEVTNMADAVILDACASTAVENVCDHFEFDLRAEVEREGLYLTDRFSPGYGDFPLSVQGRLCDSLNTARRIGLTVSPNLILVPRKSVTAVLGISERPQKLRKRGCEVCSMFLNCPYRKEGVSCHG